MNELQWAELITELTTVVLQAGLQLAVRRFSVLYVTKALGGNDSHDCRRLNHHHHARYTDSQLLLLAEDVATWRLDSYETTLNNVLVDCRLRGCQCMRQACPARQSLLSLVVTMLSAEMPS